MPSVKPQHYCQTSQALAHSPCRDDTGLVFAVTLEKQCAQTTNNDLQASLKVTLLSSKQPCVKKICRDLLHKKQKQTSTFKSPKNEMRTGSSDRNQSLCSTSRADHLCTCSGTCEQVGVWQKTNETRRVHLTPVTDVWWLGEKGFLFLRTNAAAEAEMLAT